MNTFWRFLERNEFWVGFIAGILFWWLYQKIRPLISSLRQDIRQRLLLKKESKFSRLEKALQHDLLEWLQSNHLAASLFSLSEILIEPSLLAPPLLTEPGTEVSSEDITSIIPYMPDWPQMAAVYKATKLGLTDTMEIGANLAIIGRPGSGKTTALAYLTQILCEPERENSTPGQRIPVWLKASDLILITGDPIDPVDQIIQSISIYLKKSIDTKLTAHIVQLLLTGKIIILVDGLDELAPEAISQCIGWIKTCIDKFQSTQFIVTARQDYFDGLIESGFTPVALASWDNEQKQQFLKSWQLLWMKYIQPDIQIDPAILNAWGLNDTTPTTPMEWMLKVWALYAGDLTGPSSLDMVEAYIRRISGGIQHARLVLEYLAGRLHSTGSPCTSSQVFQEWLKDFVPDANLLNESDEQDTTHVPSESALTLISSQMIQEFINRGILTSHGADKLGFSHLTIFAFLVAVNGNEKTIPSINIEIPGWVVDNERLKIVCLRSDDSSIVDQYIHLSQDPLQDQLLDVGYWLVNAPEKVAWRNKVLRSLAGIIQNDNYPLAIKSRAITALVYSKSAGMTAFIKQLLESTLPTQRMLAALAFGMLRDNKSVQDLSALTQDPVLDVQRAACLSLVAIGNRPALEAVAQGLLDEDERHQQITAEALANHPDEGYPTLKEGASIDKVSIRRAVVFGLRRINHLSWAKEILEKMRVSEDQWIVKDAANQALTDNIHINRRIFTKLPPLWEIPWLIAFASENGQGVARGEVAADILLQALKDGNDEQRCAAMDVLRYTGSDRGILIHYQNLFSGNLRLQEASTNTIWHLTRTGVKFPPPTQFGLV